MKKMQNCEYSYWTLGLNQVVFEDEFDLIIITKFNKGPKAIRVDYIEEEKDSGIKHPKQIFIQNLNVIHQTEDIIYFNNYDVASEIGVENNMLKINFDIEIDNNNRWDSEEFSKIAKELIELKHK